MTRAHRIAVVVGAVVAIDQLTKATAVLLADGSDAGLVVPVTNRRSGLGLVGASTPVMALIAAIGIVAFGGAMLRQGLRGRVPVWVPALLIGGAVSNLADRVAIGAVRDFLATPWVILNMADAAVVAGLAGWACALRSPLSGRGERALRGR